MVHFLGLNCANCDVPLEFQVRDLFVTSKFGYNAILGIVESSLSLDQHWCDREIYEEEPKEDDINEEEEGNDRDKEVEKERAIEFAEEFWQHLKHGIINEDLATFRSFADSEEWWMSEASTKKLNDLADYAMVIFQTMKK
ncbi:hypothetical protein SUGI_0234950 [Cryptomeria japonica]|nr:hypothetical protein SUGI_0234950 [Cryptomeria japonica]